MEVPTLVEPLLDSKTVASILGVHRQTVLRLARSGQLPGIRYARQWRFRRRDIEAWIDMQAAPSPPPGISTREFTLRC